MKLLLNQVWLRFEGRSSYNVDYIPHPLEANKNIRNDFAVAFFLVWKKTGQILDVWQRTKSSSWVTFPHTAMKLSRKKPRPRCFPKHVKDDMIRSCYQARDSAKPPKNVWEPGRTHLGFYWVPNVHSFVDCVKKSSSSVPWCLPALLFLLGRGCYV